MRVTILAIISTTCKLANHHSCLLAQDCLGDQAENYCWHGCWSWLLHRSEPEPQYSHGSTKLWEADLLALPCLVEGNSDSTQLFDFLLFYSICFTEKEEENTNNDFSLVWYQGLKTGMYYLRTRAAADAIKFTVDTTLLKVICAEWVLALIYELNLLDKISICCLIMILVTIVGFVG